MAKLIRDEEAKIVDGRPIFTYHWKGIGVAYMPDFWIRYAELGIPPTLIIGGIALRPIGYEQFPGGTFIVRANWRWPLWWLLLRIWLFFRWFERNLRLTAAVWGLLRREMGAVPRWSDFVVWRWVRTRGK